MLDQVKPGNVWFG